METLEQILEHTKPNGDCMEWQGGKDRNQYGRVWIDEIQKHRLAHRVVYELKNNVTLLPPEKVCHSCDNPICINPDHLFIGSQFENMLDAVVKGRMGKRITDKDGTVYLSYLDCATRLKLTKKKVEGIVTGGVKNNPYGLKFMDSEATPVYKSRSKGIYRPRETKS